MNPSNFFHLAYWLDPTSNTQPASPHLWGVVLTGVIWAVLWLIALRRTDKGTALTQVVAGLLLAAVGVGRILALPILGWRISWLMAAGVAILPFAWRWLRLAKDSQWLQQAAHMLAFVPQPLKFPGNNASVPLHMSPWIILLPWLGLHLLGMAAVTSIHRWPLWLGWLLMGLTLLPSVGRRAWSVRREAPLGSRPSLFALTPLLLVYLTIAVRVLIGLANYLLHGEYRVPEPFSTLFNPTLALLVGVGYGLVLSCRMALSSDAALVKLGAAALVGLSIAWSLWTGLSLRTHGVSGSDPYAYTQMGIDLATHGSVFHSFPLVRLTYALEIPSEPVVHIGYKLPTDVTRTAPTVWPPAYAVFTGLAYLLDGETGVFVLTPVLGIVSLLVVGWLVRLVIRDWAIVALTIFLTATSYQQIEWQLIPMADIAAQLFSLLALVLAIRSQQSADLAVSNQRSATPHPLIPSPAKRHPLTREVSFAPRSRPYALRLVLPALAGLCIGIAFGIRYTQVLIAPAIALALIVGRPTAADRPPGNIGGQSSVVGGPTISAIFTAALCATLAALPTLAYHAIAFGSAFQTGSDELKHFSLALLPQTVLRVGGELLWYREFGLLVPFILIGLIGLWRSQRRMSLILLSYVLPVLIFHMLYSYLRQRDLLSIFPIFYLWAAIGIVTLIQRITSGKVHLAGAAALIALVCFLLFQRSIETIMLPITRGFGAFGYLVREQRQSFDTLATLTPENAVIACSLNSGAVDLHAQRLSFRPAGYTPEQLTKLVRALHSEGRPVFLLDDGKELAESIQTLRDQFTLTEVGQLDVPYYFPNSGGSENRRVPLYKIE